MVKSKNKKYGVLIMMGLFSFLALFLYLINILTSEGPFQFAVFAESYAISFPYMILLAWVDYKLVVFINHSNWLARHLLIRIVFESITLSLLATAFVALGNWVFYYHNFYDYLVSKNFCESMIGGILINIFTVTVIEFFVQNKRNEKLQQENAQMQYRQLKSQINPHFLFNSLNVLVSLINKDSERAINYTKKLSDVYRYVLTHDLEDIVSVGKELDFIRNYIEILQIRFGDGLVFVFDVNENDIKRCIPPMALQVLVENAVKHNALSSSNPLTINISSDNQNLIVSNNIIPRMRVEKNMGIGLENLMKKYYIVASKTVTVENNKKEFTVKLPLL